MTNISCDDNSVAVDVLEGVNVNDILLIFRTKLFLYYHSGFYINDCFVS